MKYEYEKNCESRISRTFTSISSKENMQNSFQLKLCNGTSLYIIVKSSSQGNVTVFSKYRRCRIGTRSKCGKGDLTQQCF